MGKEIKMRTKCDCMVACLAMLMNWTYKQTTEYFPPKAVKETGYMWEWLIPYLRANKIYIVWYGVYSGNLLTSVDWSKPSMVTVPSLTAPELGDHVIFWDGKKVVDPTIKKKKYILLPDEIFDVRQIKT